MMINKIYIVYEPADNPHAGGGWIKIIFLNEKEAKDYVENYNKDKKYEYEKYYYEDYIIGEEYL